MGDNSGTLISQNISLCNFSDAKLSFWSWYQTEPQAAYINNYDVKYVYILNEAGTTLRRYQIVHPAYAAPAGYKLNQVMNSWNELEIDLTPFVGQVITVKFFFDTIDYQFNNYEGWYIDDIKVTGDYQFPVNEATLMVRLKEGATVCHESGETSIESGDIITGQPSGATAKVIQKIKTVSGEILLLNNIEKGIEDKSFDDDTQIVFGTDETTIPITGFRERDNYIRAYYADPTGCGTPDGDLRDEERDANPRGDDIQWPPDLVADWAVDYDYFTLVQWDAVNSSKVSEDIDVEGKARWFKETSVDEPDAIIRSNELTTPDTDDFGYPEHPELGLHALGHGATNVYFDDFAIQAEIRAKRTGFLPSTQQ